MWKETLQTFIPRQNLMPSICVGKTHNSPSQHGSCCQHILRAPGWERTPLNIWFVQGVCIFFLLQSMFCWNHKLRKTMGNHAEPGLVNINIVIISFIFTNIKPESSIIWTFTPNIQHCFSSLSFLGTSAFCFFSYLASYWYHIIFTGKDFWIYFEQIF